LLAIVNGCKWHLVKYRAFEGFFMVVVNFRGSVSIPGVFEVDDI